MTHWQVAAPYGAMVSHLSFKGLQGLQSSVSQRCHEVSTNLVIFFGCVSGIADCKGGNGKGLKPDVGVPQHG